LALPVWGTMADGRLPALASPSISDSGKGWGRLPRALEAVAGTLMSLSITGRAPDDLPAGAWYELGAAIGKLRRLRYLQLHVSSDGRDYHALGRGLAASGGCPKLAGIDLVGFARKVDWLAYEPSLILPSVRNLSVSGGSTEEEALLFACCLVQLATSTSILFLCERGFG
jgi:hypothetical protein